MAPVVCRPGALLHPRRALLPRPRGARVDPYEPPTEAANRYPRTQPRAAHRPARAGPHRGAGLRPFPLPVGTCWYSADVVVGSCGGINSAALLLRSANDALIANALRVAGTAPIGSRSLRCRLSGANRRVPGRSSWRSSSTLAGRRRWPAQNRPDEQGAFAFRSVSVHTEMVAPRMSPNRVMHASGVRAVQGW